MAINEKAIIERLGNIQDPDIGKTLAELNSIAQIEIDGKLIKIHINLLQPIHWVAEKINNLCLEALHDLAPDHETEISFGEIPVNHEDRDFLKGVKNIIAVASGKGGVGKSAVAANIAASLSLSGAAVGILDGDIYGPSQPTMFGLEGEQLLAMEMPDGKTAAYPIEKYNIKVASMGFIMNRDEAAIIRGPMLAGYFSMMFEQIEWGPLDFLVFDLPPGTGDIQLTLVQKIPLTGAVIVTTPQDISLADVRRAISMFNRVDVDILGIVENMSYFVPPDMPDRKYYIFGQGGGKRIADEAGVSLLGEIPLDISMRIGNDGGKPIILNQDGSVPALALNDITAGIVSAIRKKNYDESTSGGIQISI
ncbi:MAG: Iron-sulfur cluster carrier protein [Bacteroidota bacterium]|nr:Iron-sulfur cluster carrier protein [Bacteroidota bacterium]